MKIVYHYILNSAIIYLTIIYEMLIFNNSMILFHGLDSLLFYKKIPLKDTPAV